VQSVSKISNLCGPDPPTSHTDRRTDGRTDRRTDGRTTCNRNTALCTTVHRAVKTSPSNPYTRKALFSDRSNHEQNRFYNLPLFNVRVFSGHTSLFQYPEPLTFNICENTDYIYGHRNVYGLPRPEVFKASFNMPWQPMKFVNK